MSRLVSFGGCAFAYPWSVGVAFFLQQRSTHASWLAASNSAGFAAALTAVCNVPPSTHKLALACAVAEFQHRLLGPLFFPEHRWLGIYHDVLIPHESEIIENACSGRLFIGFTRIATSWHLFGLLPQVRLKHVVAGPESLCSSLYNLVYTISCSQRLPPFWACLGVDPTPEDGGRSYVFDGAATASFPVPREAKRIVRISPVSSASDIVPGKPISASEVVTPPSPECFQELVEQGWKDAERQSHVFEEAGIQLTASN
jgi:hypothetical protein